MDSSSVIFINKNGMPEKVKLRLKSLSGLREYTFFLMIFGTICDTVTSGPFPFFIFLTNFWHFLPSTCILLLHVGPHFLYHPQLHLNQLVPFRTSRVQGVVCPDQLWFSRTIFCVIFVAKIGLARTIFCKLDFLWHRSRVINFTSTRMPAGWERKISSSSLNLNVKVRPMEGPKQNSMWLCNTITFDQMEINIRNF